MFKLKNDEFRRLKTNLTKLNKSILEIEQKIDAEGIETYFSVNSDILEYAHNIYISMRILGYIKNFEEIG
jgi:DNA mismatch repair ATPase MutS